MMENVSRGKNKDREQMEYSWLRDYFYLVLYVGCKAMNNVYFLPS